MVYLDTSAIVALYVKEKRSREISNWIVENNQAIPLTNLHELEFSNAIRLKQFRDEIDSNQAGLVVSRFREHAENGIFYSPQVDWTAVFKLANELSVNHTSAIGSRSLDILHVAMALSISSDRLLSFDEKQKELATRAGLKTVVF